MNCHIPERLAGESREEYRDRRKLSKYTTLLMMKGPRQAPAVTKLDTSRFWLGPHLNPQRNAERRAKRVVGKRQWKKQQRYLAATEGR